MLIVFHWNLPIVVRFSQLPKQSTRNKVTCHLEKEIHASPKLSCAVIHKDNHSEYNNKGQTPTNRQPRSLLVLGVNLKCC